MPSGNSKRADPQSLENHGVLVELKDAVGAIGERFEAFSANQSKENQRLHDRIDATQERFINALSTLKDGMAEKGRLTPALVASILSMIAILCGAGGAYVSMRSEPLERSVMVNAAKIATAEVQRMNMEDRLHQLNVKSDVTDAIGETDRKWITKIQDELRTKIEKLENK